jgi:TonB family protein
MITALLSAPAARADDAQSTLTWKQWDNPFCSAVAYAEPLDKDDTLTSGVAAERYMVFLESDRASTIDAAITLITDTDAYTVKIDKAETRRRNDGQQFAGPFVVTFAQPVAVRYIYVDSVGINDIKPAACPSFVNPVKPEASAQNTSRDFTGAPTVAATHLQAIPSPTCGKTYVEAHPIGDAAALVGHYGDRPRDTLVHVFIDSNGTVLRSEIEESSGVPGLDDAALGAVNQARFAPAQFLCTPVVTEMYTRYEYRP